MTFGGARVPTTRVTARACFVGWFRIHSGGARIPCPSIHPSTEHTLEYCTPRTEDDVGDRDSHLALGCLVEDLWGADSTQKTGARSCRLCGCHPEI